MTIVIVVAAAACITPGHRRVVRVSAVVMLT